MVYHLICMYVLNTALMCYWASKKSCPFLYSKSLYESGQHFLYILYYGMFRCFLLGSSLVSCWSCTVLVYWYRWGAEPGIHPPPSTILLGSCEVVSMFTLSIASSLGRLELGPQHFFLFPSLAFFLPLCVYVYPFVCLSLCLFFHLSLWLFSPWLFVSLSICPFVCFALSPFVPLSLCLCVSLSLCAFVCFSLRLFVPLTVCLFCPLSVCPFISLFVCFFVPFSVIPFFCLSLCLFVPLSVCPFNCLSVLLFVSLSLYFFICVFLCPFVCLSLSLFIFSSICPFVSLCFCISLCICVTVTLSVVFL